MPVLARFRWWRRRSSILREIDLLQDEQEGHLVRSLSNPLRQAVQSLDGGNLKQAAQFWEQARRLIPRHILASTDTIHFLLRTGRLDELESLMVAGHAKSRTNALYLEGLARLAEQRDRIDEALTWWSKLRKTKPGIRDGWLVGAACLKKAGRNEEAASVLQSSILYFETDHDLRIELASARETLADWPRALQEWNYVAETLGLSAGHCGAARICERAGDLPGARLRLTQGLVKHPYQADLLIALARLEERLGNLPTASAYWADLRLSRPHIEIGYREGIRCFRLAGQLEKARLVYEQASQRFPGHFLGFDDVAISSHADAKGGNPQ